MESKESKDECWSASLLLAQIFLLLKQAIWDQIAIFLLLKQAIWDKIAIWTRSGVWNVPSSCLLECCLDFRFLVRSRIVFLLLAARDSWAFEISSTVAGCSSLLGCYPEGNSSTWLAQMEIQMNNRRTTLLSSKLVVTTTPTDTYDDIVTSSGTLFAWCFSSGLLAEKKLNTQLKELQTKTPTHYITEYQADRSRDTYY
jgi:hypothetical protein